MDAVGTGLLFCSSGGGLEPFLGTVLKKTTGKLGKKKKKRKARRKKEVQTLRLRGKNMKYWEDGVHLFCFFLEERRSGMAQRHEG